MPTHYKDHRGRTMDGFVRIDSLSHPSMWALVGAFSVIVKTLPKFGLQGYTAGPFTNADADSLPNVFLQFQQYSQHSKMDNSLINHKSCSCYNYKIYICYHRSHNKLFLEPFRLSVMSRSRSNVVCLCSFY